MVAERQRKAPLLVQASIGFLSVVLLILLMALAMRLIIPRVDVERTREDTGLIGRVVQIEVLNGCGVAGAANRMTNRLRRFGFDVVETGNFDHFDVKRTLVISRNGDMEAANRVADMLGLTGERVLREESPDYYLDMTILIGADFEELAL